MLIEIFLTAEVDLSCVHPIQQISSVRRRAFRRIRETPDIVPDAGGLQVDVCPAAKRADRRVASLAKSCQPITLKEVS